MVAGLLSGAYPALVLSSFRPAGSLRTSQSGPAGSGRLRTALVVLQFSVSIGLGIAAAVIFAQISFSRSIDLGFRKDAVVVANIASIPPNTADSIARALRSGPDIAGAVSSDDIPFSGGHNHVSVTAPGAAAIENFVMVRASPDYIPLYGIPLLAGRLLSEERAGDGPASAQVLGGKPFNILINASAARRLGYSPREAVGKTLTLTGFLHSKITIVGVVADTKQDGPKNTVEGTVYTYLRAFPLDDLSIRIRGEHVRQALSYIDRTWQAFAPGTAIQRHFLDDDYDKQFQADERQGALFGIFVAVAIFIACLGLFGLAAFTAGRRTKEIGIRKVFGARTRNIVVLLLWQFSTPVLVANAIAWPIAWYYLHGWLQGFAYRIALSPIYFAGAGLAALLIAWATIFAHALRVARANPVHALRTE
jgi:putative ABC transport system permease protein